MKSWLLVALALAAAVLLCIFLLSVPEVVLRWLTVLPLLLIGAKFLIAPKARWTENWVPGGQITEPSKAKMIAYRVGGAALIVLSVLLAVLYWLRYR